MTKNGSLYMGRNIRHCEGDEKVLSYIHDQQETLAAAGYSSVTGLRDLFPLPLEQLELVKTFSERDLRHSLVESKVLVAVQELEAWFLADYRHLERINAALTRANIQNSLGIDLSGVDVETINYPSRTLREILELASLGYDKRESEVYRSVTRLDFDGCMPKEV